MRSLIAVAAAVLVALFCVRSEACPYSASVCAQQVYAAPVYAAPVIQQEYVAPQVQYVQPQVAVQVQRYAVPVQQKVIVQRQLAVQAYAAPVAVAQARVGILGRLRNRAVVRQRTVTRGAASAAVVY